MKTNLLSLVRAVANARMSQMTELAKYLDAMIDWDRISEPDDCAIIHSLVDAGTLIPNKIYLLDDGTAEVGCQYIDDYTEILRISDTGKLEWDDSFCDDIPHNKDTSNFVDGIAGSYDPIQTFTRLAGALRAGNPSLDPRYYDVVEVIRDSAQEWASLRSRVNGGYFGYVWIPMHSHWLPTPGIKLPAPAWYYRPQTMLLPRRLSAIVYASQAVMHAPSFLIPAVLQLFESDEPQKAFSWFETLTDFVPTDTLVLDETERSRYDYSALPDIVTAVLVTLGLKEDEVHELLG